MVSCARVSAPLVHGWHCRRLWHRGRAGRRHLQSACPSESSRCMRWTQRLSQLPPRNVIQPWSRGVYQPTATPGCQRAAPRRIHRGGSSKMNLGIGPNRPGPAGGAASTQATGPMTRRSYAALVRKGPGQWACRRARGRRLRRTERCRTCNAERTGRRIRGGTARGRTGRGVGAELSRPA